MARSGAEWRQALVLLARSPHLQDQMLARTVRRDYPRWLAHVRPAAGCTRPIRLAGQIYTVARIGPDLARVLSIVDTDTMMPDGVIYKPCGSRLASVCPSCSARYQRDAFQLIKAGLDGGKGVPDTVAKHPAVFDTFTAPSFGPVHARVVKRHVCQRRDRCTCRPEPCHARRDAPACPHGRRMACYRRHAATDRRVGSPLCPDCYDYPHHVVWNYCAGELWRRTRIAIERHLSRTAKQRGIDPATVKLAYGKAGEMQRRAAVHFHAVIRLDGADPADKKAILPPPVELDAQDLKDAVEHAVRATRFVTAPHPDQPAGWVIGWGSQLDQQVIAMSGHGHITKQQVAFYIAKYATKSTEQTGHVSRRLTADTIDVYADPDGSHTERLIATSWHLGRPTHTPEPLANRPAPTSTAAGPRWTCPACHIATVLPACPHCHHPAPWPRTEPNEPDDKAVDRGQQPYRGLRRWAHRLGYGGHFFTKSRRYSTTFGILRAARTTHQRAAAPTTGPTPDESPSTQDTALVVNFLKFVGAGWHTNGDALLASAAAARAREHQTLTRNAPTTIAA